MKPSIKISLTIAITAILTFVATSYWVRNSTIGAFVRKTLEVQTTNDIGRIESWDRLESLLVKGCSKEALELVRIEQALAFSLLNDSIGNDVGLKRIAEERSPVIAQRAKKYTKNNSYQIPKCE